MLQDDAVPRAAAEYATDRYGPVFLLLVGALGFTTFVDESQLARTTVSMVLVVVVFGTLRATGVTPLRLRIIGLTGVALAIAEVAGEVSNTAGVTIPVTLFVAGAHAEPESECAACHLCFLMCMSDPGHRVCLLKILA